MPPSLSVSLGEVLVSRNRMLLAIGLLIPAGYLFIPYVSLPLLLLSALLLWDTLRNADVWPAFRAFRRGDLGRMRRLLLEVRWTQYLSPVSRAYYHWLLGVAEAADGRLAAARVQLLVAVGGELRSSNDRCLIHCLLAELALQMEDEAEAREHLRIARSLEHHREVGGMLGALEQRLRPVE